MTDRRHILKIALLVVIAATLLFIFVNSALPREVSSAESEAVGGFIASIFPEGTWMNSFLTENIRKIAHFSEFGALGAEAVLYILFFAKDRRKSLLWTAQAPFIVGLTDETIQIFSGRGPEIADVWIDISGFYTFALLSLGVYAVVKHITRFRKNRKTKE